MTNQCSMTKSKWSDWQSSTCGHWNLVMHWSLVIGHCSFACPPPYAGEYRHLAPIMALLLAIPLIASAQLDQAVPASDQAAAGQALAEKWRDAVPPENAEYKGALKIRNRDGETQTVPLTFRIIKGQTNWQTIYEAGATAKTAAQKLVIVHAPGKPNEYYFASAAKQGEPPGQPVRLKEDQRAVPFAGSDFWLLDL